MQKVKNTRDRLNSQAQWIQIGVLTASILAPLVKRWNELRAAEQTLAVRENAATPAREPASDDEASRPTTSPSSIIFWVVGVGVGIVAAGVGTYLFLKRRLAADQEEPLLPLPFPRPGGAAPWSRLTGTNHRSRREMTGGPDQTSSAVGQEAGVMAASASIPSNVDAGSLGAQADVAASLGSSEPDIEAAAVVGNIRTLAYHFTDDANLPDEDNRVYFSSEEEARLAGFHRVTDEITSSENSTVE
jgi:hypothetical protein